MLKLNNGKPHCSQMEYVLLRDCNEVTYQTKINTMHYELKKPERNTNNKKKKIKETINF